MGKSTRKLTINFIYQVSYQILTMVLPLITAPYISRTLGAEQTGIYSYTYAIVSYFVIFASLGIDTYGNRCIASVKNKGENELNYMFSTLFYTHLITSILALIIYVFYIIFGSGDYKLIAFLQVFWIISAVFDINWLFFGLEKFKQTVTRSFVIKIVTVILIFLIVKNSTDTWKYVLIMSGGSVLSQVVMWRMLPKTIHLVRVQFKDIVPHFKPILILFVAVIATSLYRMIDKVMIGWTNDMEMLGCYEYADKIIRIAVSVITALGTIMLPRMTALYATNQFSKAKIYLNNSSTFVFILTFALAFGLAGISKEFVPFFFGEGYLPTILIIQILALSIPFMGWNNLIRTQVLIPNAKDKVYSIAVWSGAFINIVLNFLLIPKFNAYGAAAATVFTYFTVGLFQTIPIYKEYEINKIIKQSIPSLLIGVLMFVLVRTFANVFTNSKYIVIFEIIIGACFYISAHIFYFYITKNYEVLNFVKSLKKK